MWDCAQKKALEKSFKLVTNKSCPEWTKGAKIGYRKNCVFFNSGSTILPNIGTIQYNTNTIQYPLKLYTIHYNSIQYIVVSEYLFNLNNKLSDKNN